MNFALATGKHSFAGYARARGSLRSPLNNQRTIICRFLRYTSYPKVKPIETIYLQTKVAAKIAAIN